MWLPKLKHLNQSRQMIDTFGGYNHNLRIGDGEFYDMKNMTSDYYPVLSPRAPRTIPAAANEGMTALGDDPVTGAISIGDHVYVTKGPNIISVDGDWQFDADISLGEIKDLGLDSDTPKQMVAMGAYLIVLPDKKYINTEDWSDCGDIEHKAEITPEMKITFSMCKQDGTAYDIKSIQDTVPENPQNAELWLDTAQDPIALKRWSESGNMWLEVDSTYVRIECTGIGKGFSQADSVNISGLKDAPFLAPEPLEAKHTEPMRALDGTTVVSECGDDFIVVAGRAHCTVQLWNITACIERKMPQMDFVVEAGNRLWGCYYGINENGETVNEIYGSKLGDFKNWQYYRGISMDSWTASVGSAGKWTGAITYRGQPLFFKENILHKVYIDAGGAHQIYDTVCMGVQEGSSKSLAVVEDVLYYQSPLCFCAFGGSMPRNISTELGPYLYDTVACAFRNKYYACLKTEDQGERSIFVFDPNRGVWHREDTLDVTHMCTGMGRLYLMDTNGSMTVVGSGAANTVKEKGALVNSPVEWMVTTGQIGLTMPDMKYISRFVLRMCLPEGSQLTGYAQYDSSGQWEHLFTITGHGLRSFLLPIRPVRCDHMQLKLEGIGDCKLYSITKTIEGGSDVS